MSAGIIVMNKYAIAMAADSAVTVGNHKAIHNSANKLFALSMFEPVGAIIYSNAQFMQIPMEIIIKQYKTELGRQSFPTLQEYVENFVTFLEEHVDLFHFKENEEDYVLEICNNFLQALVEIYKKHARAYIEKVNRPLTDEEDQSLKNKSIKEIIQFAESLNKKHDGFTEYVRTAFYDKIVAYISKHIPWISEKEKLTDKICDLFNSDFTGDGYLGIAIAGYGKSEIFPHMVHLELSGILNGKLRYERINSKDINENNSATIIPLAQSDVMHTFIRGYNSVIIQQVADNTPSLIHKRIDAIPDSSLNSTQKKIVKKAMDSFQSDIVQLIQEISNADFVDPIIESVNSLPIEELALFAESMINITSVRRRVAMDGNIGTVGGPIDVAIVTRGDGLIWLKRKHYFDSKKNPQFIYKRYGQPLLEVPTDEE